MPARSQRRRRFVDISSRCRDIGVRRSRASFDVPQVPPAARPTCPTRQHARIEKAYAIRKDSLSPRNAVRSPVGAGTAVMWRSIPMTLTWSLGIPVEHVQCVYMPTATLRLSFLLVPPRRSSASIHVFRQAFGTKVFIRVQCVFRYKVVFHCHRGC
ncbi:hypothetical protein IG631_23709 [Alternaria alternata]|nr:hypothetical protein IG631_23709 [Alternaria alternata]